MVEKQDGTTVGGVTMHSFDEDYWEQHWADVPAQASEHAATAPHPYVVDETSALDRGTALDAGCGAGNEAIWLAAHGWQVTGADISATALATAAGRAARAGVQERVTWVGADLTTWEPQQHWDLVLTSYAHPAFPQLELYRRVGGWVAPGGTLLIVGHLHHDGAHAAGHHPPHEATATADDIVAVLDPESWRVETAQELTRSAPTPAGHRAPLHDVVVRATRLA